MRCWSWGLFALLAAGCATPPQAASPPPAVRVPQGKVLVTFEPFDCFCHLSGIEYAVLELPTVSGLEWNVADYKLWLAVHEPAPTDAQIRDALIYSGGKIARIDRPGSAAVSP